MWVIALAISLAASWIGYGAARRFVRARLRYVDSAQGPAIPIIAGIGAAVVAAPIVWLLPLLSLPTAVVFGISVGLGVRSGVQDIKRGYVITSGV